MHKSIASPMLVFFSAAAAIVLLTSCAQFRHPLGAATPLQTTAVNQFAAGIRPQPGDAGAHYRLGCFLQERNKHQPAIEEFKAALAIDPAHVKAYNAMGVSYDLLGAYDRAVEAYTAALQIDGRLDYVLNNLGYSYLLQGKAELAAETFQRAVDLDGGNVRYRNNLALAQAQSGRYADALTTFKESGDQANAHYNLGRLHHRAGRYAEAQAHFKAASIFKASQAETQSGLRTGGVSDQGSGRKAVAAAAPAAGLLTVVSVDPSKNGPSGFRVIPAEALSPIERLRPPPPAPRTARIYHPVPALRDRGLALRPLVHDALEADTAALLSPGQSRELLDLKARYGRDGNLSRVRIEVANGNGVRHMARNVGDFLKSGSVALMYLSNGRRFDHAETTIYYAPGYLREAYDIAQRLPGRQKLEAVPEIRGGHAEISLLIGRDLVAHVDLFRQG